MRSKTLFAALTAILLLFVFIACDSENSPVDPPGITSDTEVASPEETTQAPTEAPTRPPVTEPPTEAPTEQETFLPDDPNADYVYIKVQNPIHQGGCDPWVYLHEGSYYYCYSRGRGISVAKMSSLHTLVPKGTAVFDPPKWTEYSEELWAPELHYLGGEWYIYVAASDGYSSHHRMFVLKGTSQNPRAPYEMVGQITDPSNKWAIDGTVMELNGELYFLWSGWEGDKDGKQNLYIAHMSDPCTIDSERVMISTPEYNWETVEWPDVNEGPTVLQHGGKTFLTYSASGSWTDDYCIGMLTLVGEDPMDPASWKKSATPVFEKRWAVCYGPGHASFTTAVDGSVWMIYHGNLEMGTGWEGRSIWIAPVTFDEEGNPDFGVPQTEVQFPVGIE